MHRHGLVSTYLHRPNVFGRGENRDQANREKAKENPKISNAIPENRQV